MSILDELRKNLAESYQHERTPPPPAAPDRPGDELQTQPATAHPINQALRDHFRHQYEGENR